MKNCNKCGAQMEDGDRFCSRCGAQAVEMVFCYKCGHKCDTSMNVCPSCGTRLRITTPDPEPVPVPEPKPTPKPEPTPIVTPELTPTPAGGGKKVFKVLRLVFFILAGICLLLMNVAFIEALFDDEEAFIGVAVFTFLAAIFAGLGFFFNIKARKNNI